jgi:hypothetical protein
VKEFASEDVRIPHEDFVRLRTDGKLLLGISRSNADQISSYNALKPRKSAAAAAFKFWIITALLGLLYSIYLSFTAHWWWFLVGLVASTIVIRSNSSANQANLLDAAMIDADFYERMAQAGVWIYKMSEEDAQPYFTDDFRIGQEIVNQHIAALTRRSVHERPDT